MPLSGGDLVASLIALMDAPDEMTGPVNHSCTFLLQACIKLLQKGASDVDWVIINVDATGV